MIDPLFVFVGASLTLAGNFAYARDTLRGRVRPNRVSWLLWAVIPLVAFGAQLQEGVGMPAIMTLSVGLGPLVVWVCSLARPDTAWRVTWLDLVCGTLSLIALLLWVLAGGTNQAIGLSIVADGLAAMVTVVKAYRYPDTENWRPYLLGAVSAGITLLTLDDWSFASSGFPLYILAVGCLLFILIRFPTLWRAPGSGDVRPTQR